MENRREPRIPVTDPMSFAGTSGAGDGTIINLSVNGCAFQSGQPIDLNATLQLELCIPDQKDPVKVKQARLTWKVGDSMGVEFMNMNETSKARLRDYLDGLPQTVSK